MAIAQKQLAAPLLIGTANTTIFANPASQLSLVGGIVLFNSHTAPVTVTIWNRVPPSGGAVGTPTTAYRVFKKSLASLETVSFRIPPVNPYLDTNRALIGIASVASVVSATVCGAIDVVSPSQITYPVLVEPILLGIGTGASTSIPFQNPASTKTFITGLILHNSHTAAATVQLWHLVPPSSGSAGTPALAQQFFEKSMAADETIAFYYPFQVCYEDLARSFRARATVASVVSINLAGAVYV